MEVTINEIFFLRRAVAFACVEVYWHLKRLGMKGRHLLSWEV